MRRPLAAALALAGMAGLQACGDEPPRTNIPRPPSPVTLTAAIHEDVVQVSPSSVGAGQIVLIVNNQSGTTQRAIFETDELGGRRAGVRTSTADIEPGGTGRLTVDARRGTYQVHVRDRTVRAARVVVGPPRESAQNELLRP